MPQVFCVGDRWYCLFCTGAKFWSDAAVAALGPAVSGTHYLTADHPRGPWRLAPEPFLDGGTFPDRYAARIVADGDALRLIGFLNHDAPGGRFIGEISDPSPVEVTSGGLLRLRDEG